MCWHEEKHYERQGIVKNLKTETMTITYNKRWMRTFIWTLLWNHDKKQESNFLNTINSDGSLPLWRAIDLFPCLNIFFVLNFSYTSNFPNGNYLTSHDALQNTLGKFVQAFPARYIILQQVLNCGVLYMN